LNDAATGAEPGHIDTDYPRETLQLTLLDRLRYRPRDSIDGDEHVVRRSACFNRAAIFTIVEIT
jgi:hypothetical protein